MYTFVYNYFPSDLYVGDYVQVVWGQDGRLQLESKEFIPGTPQRLAGPRHYKNGAPKLLDPSGPFVVGWWQEDYYSHSQNGTSLADGEESIFSTDVQLNSLHDAEGGSASADAANKTREAVQQGEGADTQAAGYVEKVASNGVLKSDVESDSTKRTRTHSGSVIGDKKQQQHDKKQEDKQHEDKKLNSRQSWRRGAPLIGSALDEQEERDLGWQELVEDRKQQRLGARAGAHGVNGSASTGTNGSGGYGGYGVMGGVGELHVVLGAEDPLVAQRRDRSLLTQRLREAGTDTAHDSDSTVLLSRDLDHVARGRGPEYVSALPNMTLALSAVPMVTPSTPERSPNRTPRPHRHGSTDRGSASPSENPGTQPSAQQSTPVAVLLNGGGGSCMHQPFLSSWMTLGGAGLAASGNIPALALDSGKLGANSLIVHSVHSVQNSVVVASVDKESATSKMSSLKPLLDHDDDLREVCLLSVLQLHHTSAMCVFIYMYTHTSECVYSYVCIHAHIRTHTHMHIHTHMYEFTHVTICIHTHIRTHTYMYTHTHAYTRIRARTRTCIIISINFEGGVQIEKKKECLNKEQDHLQKPLLTHTHTHTHTHTQTHTHTHTHT